MKIEEIIKQQEGRRLEFKENLGNGNRIVQTAIAFSNDAGGEIYLGIKNGTHEIIGFSEFEIFNLEEQLSNIIFDNSQPAIVPDIVVVNYNGKYLLKITIYPGSQAPYYLKSSGKNKGTYIRVGSSNKPADEFILQDLERRSRNISYDSLPCYEVSFEEINLSRFFDFFYKQRGKKFEESAYEKLGLVITESDKRIPTNAAMLLSKDQTGQLKFQYAKIECARFKGVTTVETIDAQTINDSVCFQPDLAMNFIKRNI